MASEEAAARPGGAGEASHDAAEAKPYRVLEPSPDKRDALMRSRQDGEAALAAAQAAQAARRASPAYDTHAAAAPVGGRNLTPEDAQRRREHQLLVAKLERAEKAAQARQQAKLEEERKIQQHRDRQRQLAEQQAARQQAATRSVQEQVREARLRKLAEGATSESAAITATAAAAAATVAQADPPTTTAIATPPRLAFLNTQSLPTPTKQPSPVQTTVGSAVVPERPSSASGWTFGPPGGAAANAASAATASLAATLVPPPLNPHASTPPPAYEHEKLPRYEEAAPSAVPQSNWLRPSPMAERMAARTPPPADRRPVSSPRPTTQPPEPVYGWLHLDDGSMVYIPRPGEETPGMPLPVEEVVHVARPADPPLVDVVANVPASDAEVRLVNQLYEMGLDAVEPGALLAALRASGHDVTQVLDNFNILT